MVQIGSNMIPRFHKNGNFNRRFIWMDGEGRSFRLKADASSGNHLQQVTEGEYAVILVEENKQTEIIFLLKSKVF